MAVLREDSTLLRLARRPRDPLGTSVRQRSPETNRLLLNEPGDHRTFRVWGLKLGWNWPLIPGLAQHDGVAPYVCSWRDALAACPLGL